MLTKIYSIDDIHLAIFKTNPLTLRIVASGLVNSTGWSTPQLSPYIYIAPPVDGIYDFDFIAEKPSGIVFWPMLPITATFQWQPFPMDLKGVRVHASAGCLEAKLDGNKNVEFKALDPDDRGAAAGGEMQVPLFLTGIVVDEGIGYCRDGATHRLLHHGVSGEPAATRLKANNEEAAAFLKKVSGSRQRVSVAGYLKHGIEPGCDYLDPYYAGPAVLPQDMANKLK